METTATKTEVTKLAALLAARIPNSDLQVVDKAVRGCMISGLIPAMLVINSELDGPSFAPGETAIICAQLGVEIGSGLQSVMHLMTDAPKATGDDDWQERLFDKLRADGKTIVTTEEIEKLRGSAMLPADHWIHDELEYQAILVPPVDDEVEQEVRTKFIGDLALSMRNAIRLVSDSGDDMILHPDDLIESTVLELCGRDAIDIYMKGLKGGGE